MILIIDDDESMGQMLAAFLEMEGYPALTARDGMEGLRIYREHEAEITLVICDINMPRLDGVETYRHLKRINGDVRVIFATGFLDSKTIARLRDEGANTFLHKPCKPEEILNAVRSILRGD